MKKIILSSILITSIFAENINYIEFGGGYVKIKDNVNTTSKKISSYSDKKKDNTALGYFDIYTTFNINENIDVYLNSQIENTLIGTKIKNDYGNLELGIKYDSNEEFENPYLLNTDRKEIDTQEYGGYAVYTYPFTDYLESGVSYEYSKKDYERDLVDADLKREGNRNIISIINKFSKNISGNEIKLFHRLSFENFSADGESSAYKNYASQQGGTISFPNDIDLALITTFGNREYDKRNPLFNKKQDVDYAAVETSITFNDFINYKDIYLSLKAGIVKEDSNINFYDSEKSLALITMGYRF